MHQVIHPSKEQVRAYMARREFALRPPPAPDEIRRQLGWHLAEDAPEPLLAQLYVVLPATLGQLSVQLTFDLLYAPGRWLAGQFDL